MFQQVGHGKRLLQNRAADVEMCSLGNRLVVVARHEDDRDVRRSGVNLVGRLEAVLVRQQHVAQEHVHVPAQLEFQRLLTRGGGHHVEPVGAKRAAYWSRVSQR